MNTTSVQQVRQDIQLTEAEEVNSKKVPLANFWLQLVFCISPLTSIPLLLKTE